MPYYLITSNNPFPPYLRVNVALLITDKETAEKTLKDYQDYDKKECSNYYDYQMEEIKDIIKGEYIKKF